MNKILLSRYLSGECNDSEKKEIEKWLQSDPANKVIMDALKKIWNIMPYNDIEVNTARAWETFQQLYLEKEKQITNKKKRTGFGSQFGRKKGSANSSLLLRQSARKKYSRGITYMLAAAAVILIALLFTRNMLTVDESSSAHLALQQMITEKGERATFSLSDGTVVRLNANSRLNIPSEFMEESREVYLSGEAYFEVEHDSKFPFIIYSGETTTKVLGTKFGIRAYPDENQVRIAVSEGKVSLMSAYANSSSNSIWDTPTEKTLTVNEVGILSLDERNIQVTKMQELDLFLGWKDGKLIFKDTPLKQVKVELERWFDIECVIKDKSLETVKLTASFEKGEPLREVLNVISLTMDITYENDGKKFTFLKKQEGEGSD